MRKSRRAAEITFLRGEFYFLWTNTETVLIACVSTDPYIQYEPDGCEKEHKQNNSANGDHMAIPNPLYETVRYLCLSRESGGCRYP